MAPESHTPLESLLLFQALYPVDASPPSFSKISETLKTNELLRESDSFAIERLEPDRLKAHSLQLIQEEFKSESERDQISQRDDTSPRKHKNSIPVLESLDDPFQFNHLLPRLVNRLYFRYRNHAIKAVEEEERRYRSLQREVQEIERGEWDEKLGPEAASRRPSRGVSSLQTILRHDGEEQKSFGSAHQVSVHANASLNGGDAGGRPSEQSPVVNGVKQAPYSRGPQPSPTDHQQIKPPGSEENAAPFLPPPQPVNHGYTMGSPGSDIHRRLPPPSSMPSHPVPTPSPRSAQNTLPPTERSSASPIILPPPPGMLRSSGSPTGPLDTLADMAGQQYRASPALPSSRTAQPSIPQPHQYPPPRNYVPRGYTYYENPPPYQVPYTPYSQGPLPPVHYQHQQGAPSYQGPAMPPSHGPPYSGVPQYQSPMPQYTPPHPAYHQNHGYYQQPPSQPPYIRGRLPQAANQHTPISTASNEKRTANKPSPIITSTSSTKWKSVDAPGSIRQPSPKSPSPGAISPISEKAPSLSPEPLKPHVKDLRVQKTHHQIVDSPSEIRRGKSIRSRGTAKRGRGGRAASATSSAQADPTALRTRSHSMVSQADELSIDQPISTHKIKPDPAATSIQDDDTSVASHTADEGGRRSYRQRRATSRNLETVEIGRPSSKRKREASSGLPPPSPAPTASLRPGFVLATRNLPKISAPLINDISTHKLGNMFAKSLTDREAPGYKDLIRRPQNLRSIKLAINAGGKALLKATEGMGEEANSANVWIPETPEVVPPGGIVNSTQLEKELMRIFANAIMFNPEVPSKRGIGPAFRTRQRTLDLRAVDEEDEGQSEGEIVKGKQDVSVVKDTREIYDAVEEKVAQWRSAEKAAEEGGNPAKGLDRRLRGGGSEEVDELAGDGEEVVGTVEKEPTPEPRSKRRKR